MKTREIDPVVIGERQIGRGHEVYVIAEAGVNHNGSVERALKMCDAAVVAGADAVKFQVYRTDRLVSSAARRAKYQQANTGQAGPQHEMLRDLELTPEDFTRLAGHCRRIGIEFLASPFDSASLQLLVDIGVRAIKIASPELTDLPLLRSAAAAGLPLIVSTGAACFEEIEEAVRVIHDEGCTELILLHCVTVYPTPFELQNLSAIRTLGDRFGVVVGYSDHSLEVESGRLAVAVGASLLEKHFTLNRDDVGPDHRMSLEPDDLAAYVRVAREAAGGLEEIIAKDERARSALGDGAKQPHILEEDAREVSRKSLGASVDIAEGTVIAREMLTTLRPATGIAPGRMDDVVGATARVDIVAGEILKREMLRESTDRGRTS